MSNTKVEEYIPLTKEEKQEMREGWIFIREWNYMPKAKPAKKLAFPVKGRVVSSEWNDTNLEILLEGHKKVKKIGFNKNIPIKKGDKIISYVFAGERYLTFNIMMPFGLYMPRKLQEFETAYRIDVIEGFFSKVLESYVDENLKSY